MSLFYDLGSVVVTALFCILGVRRGFLKSLATLVSVILAMVISYFAGEALSSTVYDSFLKDRVTSAVKNQIEGYDLADTINDEFIKNNIGLRVSDEELQKIVGGDGTLSENIADYGKGIGLNLDSNDIDSMFDSYISRQENAENIYGSLGTGAKALVKSALADGSKTAQQAVKALANTDKDKAAGELEENVIAPFLKPLVSVAVSVAAFIVLMLVFRLIIFILGISKTSSAEGVNALLGGVFGLLKGILIVLVITYIFGSIVSLEIFGDDSFISEKTINDSIVFRYLYDLIN